MNLDIVGMLALEIVFTSITPRHARWKGARSAKRRRSSVASEPVQLQLSEDFSPQSHRTALRWQEPAVILQIAR